jgi:hypothetical protein
MEVLKWQANSIGGGGRCLIVGQRVNCEDKYGGHINGQGQLFLKGAERTISAPSLFLEDRKLQLILSGF